MSYGCIQVYYGNGKGKTTAAMGQCLRIAGHGDQVLIYQFLKNNNSGERKILEQLPNVTLLKGKDKVQFSFRLSEVEKKEYRDFYQRAMLNVIREFQEKSYQGIFLDEILTSIHLGYVDEKLLVELMNECRGKCELILTGHYLTQTVLDLADYVSHIQKEKHPFDHGLNARKGIEL